MLRVAAHKGEECSAFSMQPSHGTNFSSLDGKNMFTSSQLGNKDMDESLNRWPRLFEHLVRPILHFQVLHLRSRWQLIGDGCNSQSRVCYCVRSIVDANKLGSKSRLGDHLNSRGR